MNFLKVFLTVAGLGISFSASVSANAPLRAKKVYALHNSTCAVLENNRIKCWGQNFKRFFNPDRSEKAIGDRPGEMGNNLEYMDFPIGEVENIVMDASQLCVHYSRTREVYCTKGYGARLLKFPGGVLPRQISAGVHFFCGIFEDDAVRCWGSNRYQQLGFTEQDIALNDSSYSQPIDFKAPGEVPMQLASGKYSSCALFDSGKIRCWGGHLNVNLKGVLGTENPKRDLSFKVVSLGTVGGPNGNRSDGDLLAKNIYSNTNRYGYCAELMDDTVKCWGSNEYGELGSGISENAGDQPQTMGDFLPRLDLGQTGPRTGLALGGRMTCALFLSGIPKCWGYEGLLGIGSLETLGRTPETTGDGIPFIHLGKGRSAVQLSAGWQHVCALMDDGAVACWGKNSKGQAGVGHNRDVGDQRDEMGDQLLLVDLGTK